jgi:hypothetical protein
MRVYLRDVVRWLMLSGAALMCGESMLAQTIGTFAVTGSMTMPRGSPWESENGGAAFRCACFSSILYFDGVPRELQDFGCSGTQTSRRLGVGVVEILQSCRGGAAIRFLLRVSNPGTEMILDVTEQHPGGSRTERHIVLKKQTSGK